MNYFYDFIWWRVEAWNPDDVNKCNEMGLNLLHVASLKGSVEEVKESLKDTDVNSRIKRWNLTALHLAAYKGHVEIVKLLLAEGADVNVKSSAGATPLHWARTHLIVKELVDNGADVNVAVAAGKTMLQFAAFEGDLYDVRFLISLGSDIHHKGIDGCTALHLAANTVHLDIVKLLLAEGADVNVKCKRGLTPLHCTHCHLIAKKLVDNGADVNVADYEGRTPLHSAARAGNLNVVRFLKSVGSDIHHKDKYGFTALHLAAHDGYVDIVKLLLAEGADVNVKSKDGIAPIHLAHCHLIAKELVDNGADVNVVNERGSTPLHSAAWKGNLNVVRFLISVGSDIHRKGRYGYTALHKAALKDPVDDIIKLLRDKGPDVNVKSTSDMIPSHLAHSHLIAKELVDNGADVNVADEEGSTPLHFAARAGNLNVVRFLISVGSDIDRKNWLGCTALRYAVSRDRRKIGKDFYLAVSCAVIEGYMNTVKLLLTSGADINNCGWYSVPNLLRCKKYQMSRSIMEYKQQRLELPLSNWKFLLSESVKRRYRCDLLDFMIMDINASVMDLFKFFSSLVINRLFSPYDAFNDVFRRLLDYDCDYNVLAVDSNRLNYYLKDICLKHCVRLSVVKPDDRFCLEKFNGTKEEVESLKLECRSEIKVVKEIKIGDSLFTMHDVLVGNTVLAFRCVSGVGVKVIQEMDFGETPIYGGMVLCKLKRMFRRVNLIKQLKNECTEPAALLNLPDVPFDVIVKFLSDDDLEMLVKVSCARVPLSCSLGDEFWNQEN